MGVLGKNDGEWEVLGEVCDSVLGCEGRCGKVLREMWESVLGCGKILGKVWQSLLGVCGRVCWGVKSVGGVMEMCVGVWGR